MKYIYIIFAFSFLLFSCNKEEIVPETTKPPLPKDSAVRVLTLSHDSLVYSHLGATKSFDIETNGVWTITDIPAWATLSVTGGKDTLRNVNVTVNVDPQNMKRSAKITITSGKLTKKLNLLQHNEVRMITLAVPSAGSVQSLLERQSEEVLPLVKLTGQINYADLTYLRTANKQRVLDLSETTVVEGERHNGIKWVVSPPNMLDSAAFVGFTKLQSLAMPRDITHIEADAFNGCTALNAAIIPSSIISIANRAFYNCTSLPSITVPNNVRNMGTQVFAMCRNLVGVSFSTNLDRIPSQTFAYCNSLSAITIPSAITLIEYRAFYNCTAITSLNFQRNVGYIADEAFRGCSKLESVTIPNNPERISLGRYAFYDCTSLRRVYSPYNTPPLIDAASSEYSCFDSEYLDVCKLYVPRDAAAVYSRSENWASYNFRQIVEI